MAKVRTSHSVFRFRSYRMADGKVEEVFGDGPHPDGAVTLLSDDTIDQTTIKTHNIDGPVQLVAETAHTPFGDVTVPAATPPQK